MGPEVSFRSRRGPAPRARSQNTIFGSRAARPQYGAHGESLGLDLAHAVDGQQGLHDLGLGGILQGGPIIESVQAHLANDLEILLPAADDALKAQQAMHAPERGHGDLLEDLLALRERLLVVVLAPLATPLPAHGVDLDAVADCRRVDRLLSPRVR